MVVVKLSGAAFVAAMICLSSCDASAAAHLSPDQQAPAAATAQTQPAQSTTKTAQPISPSDQSLIDSVEQAYQAGITNYHDGHISAAKSNFD